MSSNQHFIDCRAYLSLGMPAEAEIALGDSETEAISEETFELRILIELKRSAWKAAELLACEAVERFPASAFPYFYQAYALHELSRTEEAFRVLTAAPIETFDRFSLATWNYNRACYLGRLNRLEAGWSALSAAIDLEPSFSEDALLDPDLASIRAFELD